MCNTNKLCRSELFIENLYREKEIHKEHRHKHVMQKFLLTSLFFGLGQLVKTNYLFDLILYAVPLIAVIHDIFIFSEHEKVHRIAEFIKKLGDEKCKFICDEEIKWEKFVIKKRARQAMIGSLLYTLIISLLSAMAIYKIDANALNEMLFIFWSIIIFIAIILVFLQGCYAIHIESRA